MDLPADDRSLLRLYVRCGSQQAFAELVKRHAGMVYQSARRRLGERGLGDRGLAEEVTQAVFILLHQKAVTLGDKVILAAWLYKATGYTALNIHKRERRRKHHEQKAIEMGVQPIDQRTQWEELSPELDAAIDRLGERDRQAVVLRFLEQRSFAEVGRAMDLSPDAAQMRVSRALNKLRDILLRRGVCITAAALGGAVLVNTVQAAPVTVMQGLTIEAIRTVKDTTLADQTARTFWWEYVRHQTLLATTAVVLMVILTVAIHHVVQRASDFIRQPRHVPNVEHHQSQSVVPGPRDWAMYLPYKFGQTSQV